MKNLIMYKVNMFFAYLTIDAPVPFFVKLHALTLQGKINSFVNYQWGN